MDRQTLCSENHAYAGTRGVSHNNRNSDFRPAFLDERTGRIEISKLENGQEATIHIISWLPKEWATSFDEDGLVIDLRPGIISGFERGGSFYTRDEVAEL